MVQFTDIVGQDAALGRLGRMLNGDRRPHAFIFAGPAGVGRRTTAEAMAAVLLCAKPVDAPPLAGQTEPRRIACGLCPSCRTFEAGTHADYHPITKELARFSSDPSVRSRVMQDLSIAVIREFLLGPSNRRATMGHGRVFVIQKAWQMSAAAQNAMLKTLEEPPPGVTLVLICLSPEQLLPTTRSRCALVRFGPLPIEFVTERLVGGGMGAEEARFWAGYTNGSIGQSVRLAEADLYGLKCDLLDRLAGLTDTVDPDLPEWLAAKATDQAQAATAVDKQLAQSLATRQGISSVLGLMASVYRDAVSLAAGREKIVHAEQPEPIGRIAGALGLDKAAEIVAQLGRYEQLLWRNVNAKVLWDNVVITCTTAAPLRI